jgi:hypothetical protein
VHRGLPNLVAVRNSDRVSAGFDDFGGTRTDVVRGDDRAATSPVGKNVGPTLISKSFPVTVEQSCVQACDRVIGSQRRRGQKFASKKLDRCDGLSEFCLFCCSPKLVHFARIDPSGVAIPNVLHARGGHIQPLRSTEYCDLDQISGRTRFGTSPNQRSGFIDRGAA